MCVTCLSGVSFVVYNISAWIGEVYSTGTVHGSVTDMLSLTWKEYDVSFATF